MRRKQLKGCFHRGGMQNVRTNELTIAEGEQNKKKIGIKTGSVVYVIYLDAGPL